MQITIVVAMSAAHPERMSPRMSTQYASLRQGDVFVASSAVVAALRHCSKVARSCAPRHK
jgi:hypothetical protein